MDDSWRTFPANDTVVVRERWRDRLWSAIPHRIVSSDDTTLVSWVPDGTASVYSSNRMLPAAAGLTREERKLLALRTLDVQPVQTREAPHKLFFHRRDRWSRVNLGWDPVTGTFLGWYVNFERQPSAEPDGVTSMDLVIDIWVDPDRTWRWKDADDFDRAIAAGIHPAALRTTIEAEAARVVSEIESASGPFADEWLAFRPDVDWPVPDLPASCAWGGAEWAEAAIRHTS